jgi:DNA-binding NarL/FixJ family response regulator
MATIRLLVVDDQAMFREGLCLLLEDQMDMTVVGEASDGPMAVALAEKTRPDVVLMGIKLSPADGIEAAEQILSRLPSTKVIALTMSEDRERAESMLRAGAQGYVLIESRAAVLLQAIRIVAAGGASIDPTIARMLLDDYRKLVDMAESAKGLSRRERTVLACLSAGMSNAEIAERLCLSRQTVKNLLSQIYGELGVRNRTEAVVAALDRGLIDREA